MGYILGIDYTEVRAVAGEFDRHASAVSDTLNAVRQHGVALLTEWDGVASQTFESELMRGLTRVRNAPQLLQQIAQSLRAAADAIWAAEQEAARIMREQQYAREQAEKARTP
jgi:WXG100 family type VII secretion target